jgi:hypothetical protein
MPNRKRAPGIALAVALPLLLTQSVQSQMKRPKYALTQFNNEGCMAKGRVQDCSGSVVLRQILTDGKSAIPILISQLTETTRTKYQIADYWFDTRSGDVAYVMLTDLFTDQAPREGDYRKIRRLERRPFELASRPAPGGFFVCGIGTGRAAASRDESRRIFAEINNPASRHVSTNSLPCATRSLRSPLTPSIPAT